jgi:hypothetical protein
VAAGYDKPQASFPAGVFNWLQSHDFASSRRWQYAWSFGRTANTVSPSDAR